VLVTVRTGHALAEAVKALWAAGIPFRMLGGGSNVLVADNGLRGVVIVNKADQVRFGEDAGRPMVEADAGASFGGLGRRSAARGLAGLEWAGAIPGTVGGAVVGNAGAFGGDVAGRIRAAEILHPPDRVESWPAERLEFRYRGSWLKDHPGQAVVLAASFWLQAEDERVCQERLQSLLERRQETQPAGASWGSMFKNPPGDHAGRLIEAAGLKGLRQGGAQISPQHANFFLNLGDATAADVRWLMETARTEVQQRFGVQLDPEIEMLGFEALEGEPGRSGA
jgi:UDP-N-acetylmuramate dehydrogenase